MPAPVIIVTGVSHGIGRAIGEELHARGAVVGAALAEEQHQEVLNEFLRFFSD
jgi:NAD(P)-dependent dehydrogenase (short-subunit alcohol dehydrogenase family)